MRFVNVLLLALLIIADEYTATARGSFSDLKHLF